MASTCWLLTPTPTHRYGLIKTQTGQAQLPYEEIASLQSIYANPVYTKWCLAQLSVIIISTEDGVYLHINLVQFNLFV